MGWGLDLGLHGRRSAAIWGGWTGLRQDKGKGIQRVLGNGICLMEMEDGLIDVGCRLGCAKRRFCIHYIYTLP